MESSPKILVVDDFSQNIRLLVRLLEPEGYRVVGAETGPDALELLVTEHPDLVILDVVMPRMTGYEVCERIRQNPDTRLLPVIMVTGLDQGEERVKGIEAGADDFLSKPINTAELLARVRSLLRIKQLHEKVQAQAAELAELNQNLERRVKEQVSQLERLGKLKRFFSPQLAELIVAGGAEDPLEIHRREITVVFVDLRGFTAFNENAAPEEVMGVLREYHREMGSLILRFEGTLERFAGDGMMIFFNDPSEIPDAIDRAVRMAVAMKDSLSRLSERWRARGHLLSFGIGIAVGPATIGAIGFEGRWDYGAIGSVTNLASRLCDEAQGGQILISSSIHEAVREVAHTTCHGEVSLKGFSRPLTIHSVQGLAPDS